MHEIIPFRKILVWIIVFQHELNFWEIVVAIHFLFPGINKCPVPYLSDQFGFGKSRSSTYMKLRSVILLLF